MQAPNGNRLKALLMNLGLLCIGTCLALVLAEVLVRIFSPSDVPWQRDALLGHSHVPGKKGIYREGGFRTPFRFNSEGWRDREYPLEKREDAFRILLLGDSFAEALQLPVEQTFPELLETRLNEEEARPVELINTGVGAFSTDQQYLMLKHHGARYSPDLVILAFCVENDVYGNLLELRGDPHKPYFIVDDSGSLVQREFHLPANEKAKAFLRNHLQLYMFVRKRLSRADALASALMRFGLLQNADYLRKDDQGVLIDYSTHLAHYPPAWQRAWDITEALLLAVRDEASEMNAGFLVVLINYNVLVHDHLWQEALDTYPSMNNVEWDRGKANRLILSFCARHHIECLDLLPKFREEAQAGEILYLPVDGHWNEEGHQLAATLLYEKLRETWNGKGLSPSSD